jgi:hypothetical protein
MITSANQKTSIDRLVDNCVLAVVELAESEGLEIGDLGVDSLNDLLSTFIKTIVIECCDE